MLSPFHLLKPLWLIFHRMTLRNSEDPPLCICRSKTPTPSLSSEDIVTLRWNGESSINNKWPVYARQSHMILDMSFICTVTVKQTNCTFWWTSLHNQTLWLYVPTLHKHGNPPVTSDAGHFIQTRCLRPHLVDKKGKAALLCVNLLWLERERKEAADKQA